MPSLELVDFSGVYGAPTSRDELIRILKEALALVENLPRGTPVTCSPWQAFAELAEPSGPNGDSHRAAPGQAWPKD